MFPLFMTLIFPFITLAIGFALGSLIKLVGGWRFCLLVLTLLMFYPWWLHVDSTQSSLTNDPDPNLEPYRLQLADITDTFVSTNVLLGVGTLVITLLTWQRALLSATLPLLLGFFYYHVPLGRLMEGVAAVDRELFSTALADSGLTTAWLFWLSLAASALLFGYALTKHVEPHILKAYLPLK